MEPTPLPTSGDWRADISTRFWARLVDGVLLGIPSVVLIVLVADFGDVEGGRLDLPFWAVAASVLAAALYEIGFIAMSGQTIGKRALKIQVVDVGTGRPPGLGGATLRYLVPSVPALLPGIGPFLGLLVYLSAVWNPSRQGWHDRSAGTVVVRTAARQAITGGWAEPGPEAGP
ncbi:MAG: RDD family protein [Acidimicrobiales bacterium]